MRKIKFIGWKKGMNKIEFIQLLHHYANFSLTDSKSIKDKIVDGEKIEIQVKEATAQYILDLSQKYGVIVEG